MKTQPKTLPPELYEAMNICHEFMPAAQYRSMRDGLKGEESQYFADKFMEFAERIKTMPKTYEQDGLGDKAIAHLHYFKGRGDWYITEKDIGSEEEPGQHQAFGLADLGLGGDLGYISIVELIKNNVELDLHWKPKTLAEIQRRKP